MPRKTSFWILLTLILSVAVALGAQIGPRRPRGTKDTGTAPATSTSVADLKNTTIPLAQHPQGQAMMASAAKEAALVDISVSFLDKDYKDDIYGPRNPLTGKKIRLSCRRFRAVSGFRMKIDPPEFKLTTQGGLTINQNISRISAQGLKVKWQLGPCAWAATGVGVSMSNVKFVYKARPMLAFDGNGHCRLTFNAGGDPLRVAIGGFNITGVQNDLDRLAKDAFREGLNFTLGGGYSGLISNALTKVTLNFCGGG